MVQQHFQLPKRRLGQSKRQIGSKNSHLQKAAYTIDFFVCPAIFLDNIDQMEGLKL